MSPQFSHAAISIRSRLRTAGPKLAAGSSLSRHSLSMKSAATEEGSVTADFAADRADFGRDTGRKSLPLARA